MSAPCARLLVSSLLAAPLAAQLPPAPLPQAERAHLLYPESTIETLFTEFDIQTLTGTGFVGMNEIATMPDGDLLIGINGNPGTGYVVHRENDNGALTTVLTESDIYPIVGGSQSNISFWGMDVDLNGDVYLLLSDSGSFFGPTLVDVHLIRMPLVGAAPGGFGAPTSLFSFPAEGFSAAPNLRTNVTGTVDLVIDNGIASNDNLSTTPGNGLYRWAPGISTLPAHLESFTDIAAVMSGGGPSLTGGLDAEDIGVSNMTVGIEKVFLVMARTSEGASPNNDAQAQEPYDGDIVVVDLLSGTTEVLISRAKYLAHAGAAASIGTDNAHDITQLNVLCDPFRNRLYTLEQTFMPDASLRHAQILQWDATTGNFETVIASFENLQQPWTSQGIDPLFYSTTPGFGTFGFGLAAYEGSMNLEASGAIVVAIAPGNFQAEGHVLRITPHNL